MENKLLHPVRAIYFRRTLLIVQLIISAIVLILSAMFPIEVGSRGLVVIWCICMMIVFVESVFFDTKTMRYFKNKDYSFLDGHLDSDFNEMPLLILLGIVMVVEKVLIKEDIWPILTVLSFLFIWSTVSAVAIHCLIKKIKETPNLFTK